MPTKRAQMPEEDLVRLYLSDIGRYPLLTKDDEARLAREAEAGRDARAELTGDRSGSPARVRELRRVVRPGDAAVETFVNGNLRLVVSIAPHHPVQVRPGPGRATHSRGGWPPLWPHPGAHPPDRSTRHVEVAPPHGTWGCR